MTLPTTAPAAPPATRAQTVAFGVLALGFLLLGLLTLKNFLDALAWAGIFAIALWPLYEKAVARFPPGRHNILMPSVFTLGVAFLFILPLGVVGVQLASQADKAQDWLQDVRANGIAEPAALEHLPFGQAQLDHWWQQNLGTPANAQKLVQQATRGHVAHVGQLVGEQVIRRLTDFVFTLLTLFFLFKEGHSLTRQTRRVATRAFGLGGERIGRQIIASVHGTVNGLVLVGLGEGVLLGIVYAVAGVPQATVLGLLTAVAAMVPFAGSIMFSIAALLLLAQGSIIWAIIVFVTGMIVMFVADHFIRPVLIGGATRLPFLWVLLGILGGVEVWGLLGLFIGPAIMAALILLWREWAGEGPV
ncbi:AI-2E family transporter [Acidisoma sp.]|uniref:AI-2E family transporter n=1 Tax=Acidisoma sp. TaxID=1872115 RepID=UPI003B009054